MNIEQDVENFEYDIKDLEEFGGKVVKRMGRYGEEVYVSSITVIKSKLGNYIGRTYLDKEITGKLSDNHHPLFDGIWLPYDRLSEEFYSDWDTAVKALENASFTLKKHSLNYHEDEQVKHYFKAVKEKLEKSNSIISEDIDE